MAEVAVKQQVIRYFQRTAYHQGSGKCEPLHVAGKRDRAAKASCAEPQKVRQESRQRNRHNIRFGWLRSCLSPVSKTVVPRCDLVYFAEFVSSSAVRRIFASFTASLFAQKCM
jgi:hypothetical protein